MMKRYNNGIFPRSLCIVGTIEEANELFINPCKQDGEFRPVENTLAMTCIANSKDKEEGCWLLIINRPLTVRTICHEALHITRNILEDLPCPLGDDTEEIWCYLIGWVAECIEDYEHGHK